MNIYFLVIKTPCSLVRSTFYRLHHLACLWEWTPTELQTSKQAKTGNNQLKPLSKPVENNENRIFSSLASRDPAAAALTDPYLGQSIGPVPGYGVSLSLCLVLLALISYLFLRVLCSLLTFSFLLSVFVHALISLLFYIHMFSVSLWMSTGFLISALTMHFIVLLIFNITTVNHIPTKTKIFTKHGSFLYNPLSFWSICELISSLTDPILL